jgi:hypothetical protein
LLGFLKELFSEGLFRSAARDGRGKAGAGVPGRCWGHAVVGILRLVRLITPPSKDRSLGTPMTPDFAQEDERKTSNGKNNDRSRFLGFASE